MLAYFVSNVLSDNVNEIMLFCDGCSAQNKNYTVIRSMYHLVHDLKRFKTVKMLFPIRGHSYMECDSDFAHVNFKKDLELPDDWRQEFREARKKPFPMNVINVDQDMLLSYSNFLLSQFKASCPFKTRPVRELHVVDTRPNQIMFRNNWNGCFESAVVKKAVVRGKRQPEIPDLQRNYDATLPISREKYNDLQVLRQFCNPANHAFYDSCITTGKLSQVQKILMLLFQNQMMTLNMKMTKMEIVDCICLFFVFYFLEKCQNSD